MKVSSHYGLKTFSLLAILTIASGMSGKAANALTLTAYGSTAGFSLSTFATNFPTAFNIGPLGITFPTSGGVLVTDFPGNVRLFPTDTDGQDASTITPSATYSLSDALGLAQVGNAIYMTQQGAGTVVQVNANGTFNKSILSDVYAATGIVANPANGHLFVTAIGLGSIIDVDPIAKTFSTFAYLYGDGLSITKDGKTLYVASGGEILGYDTTTKAQVFASGYIPGGVDGTALGVGSIAGNIYTNNNDGTVWQVDLTTKAQTLIASGGTRGDFLTVDPNSCSLLLTQTSTIERLTAPKGACFVAPDPKNVPEPSPLFGLGAIVTLGVLSRFSKKAKSPTDNLQEPDS